MAETENYLRRSSSSSSSYSSRRGGARKGRRTTPASGRGISQRRSNTPSKGPSLPPLDRAKVDTDLTSFPSLSPDRPPEGFIGEPALNRSLANALAGEGPQTATQTTQDVGDGPGDSGRTRKATLAKLTNASPTPPGRAALFDDSVSLLDFPGALHLADDAHIERLVASTGAVKLVRQFARDLAVRDAEISRLRLRADQRERELKRMLREVSVSNQDIERRLYALDRREEESIATAKSKTATGTGRGNADVIGGIDGLMQQAMADDVGSEMHEEVGDGSGSGLQWSLDDSIAKSRASSRDPANSRRRQSSTRWQDYIFGSAAGSRKTSRAGSVKSDAGDTDDLQNPVHRKNVGEQQVFNPNGTKTTAGDDSSTHSRKSSTSLSSWAAKLFVGGNGNSQSKDEGAEGHRNRTPPITEQQPRGRTTSGGTPKGSMSAMAALKRINNTSTSPGASGRGGSGPGPRVTPASRKTTGSNLAQGTSAEAMDQNSTNLGPVEMDAILPMESRPPTLTQTYNNYSQSGDLLLTDRFGFIYDQRRKTRQREARNASGNRLSIAETLGSFRSENSDGAVDDDRDSQQTAAGSQRSPSSAASPEDPESGAVNLRKWQDYLRMPSKPTELLSHTPSAGPIVALTTGDDSAARGSFSVGKGGTVSANTDAPSASTSAVVADRPEFSRTVSHDEPPATTINQEQEPVRLLLEQLTDLHDNLQRDRTVRWNEFLRKVRAERKKEGEAAAAAAAAADRPLQTIDTPEASLADGEVIGIAGLGNKGKVGRAKWREFRTLVLGGIPVALRAKVWAECSGASAMRIPGYYDDLVQGAGGEDPDPSVIAQIDVDIHRTCTDNVFFRKGPGVSKLRDVLLAYSRRNPEVGYCQGMNLIAASLLLIMPTAEDAFWILTSMVEVILPQHYYDHGLLASRADQIVLRQYISDVLPKLSLHLEDLGIELEALTFQWFLSVFTDCLSAEALYRVWDVVLCLNVTSTVNPSVPENEDLSSTAKTIASGGNGGSTFLFQLALALLKLNEQQLLTTCDTPAALYTYINHQMTNHAISIDGLIHASEALRNVVRREDVVARRAEALKEMQV